MLSILRIISSDIIFWLVVSALLSTNIGLCLPMYFATL